MLTAGASAGALVLISGLAFADAYDPPAGYYATATSTNPATLAAQLHDIIDDHIERTYDNATKALGIIDEDPANPSNVILIYDGQSVSKIFDPGIWNREHCWPRSRGIDSSGPDNADFHMLRACDTGLNGTRSNKPYGTISSSYFDPGAYTQPQDRGEAARAVFYAEVRYDGSDAATNNLLLVDSFPSGAQMGDLSEALEWHYAYGPDEKERRRNFVIWTSDPAEWFDPLTNLNSNLYHQGNRNPFIDHPEFAFTIWGGANNNATLYVGGAPNADGSSSMVFDLGEFIEGAPVASTVIVPIEKSGAHPAAFSVSTSGDASSPEEGLPQTYPFTPAPAGVGQPEITVELTTAGTGLHTGDVTIHNAQLTSAAPGQGSDDADDTITISGTALESANASFQSPADVNELTVDLGTVYRYGYEPSAAFSIRNLPGAFRADLDLDSISPSGSSAVCTTDLTTFSGLAPGGSQGFTATVDSSVSPTTYAAVYTLSLSDEDIPGEVTGQTIELTVTATVVPPGCIGDLDNDNDTDVLDFSELASNFGSGPGATRNQGDFNGDGWVDVLDFGLFAGDFGCVP